MMDTNRNNMKTNILITLLAIAFFAISCGEDEIDRPAIDLQNGSFVEPSFSNNLTGNGGVLSGAIASDTFEVFTWSSANYDGVSLVTNYTAEVSSTDDFASPLTLFTTSETSRVVTNGEVNAAMLSLGLPANAEATFYLRLYAKATGKGVEGLDSLVSASISRTATSFVAIADPLYFVGGGSAAGWNNPASPITNHYPLFPSVDDASVYSYTGFFLNDGFKLLDFPDGSWGNQYGAGAPGQLSRDGGSGNLSTGAEGYFTLNVNKDALTYSVTAFDESATTDYTSVGIGITGEAAGGWDEFPTRYSLTQSTFDKHIWFATGVTFTAGQFKLKQDSPGWGVQWGTANEGENNWPYDKATFNGANFVAEPGTYTVFFNDITGDYWMIEE